MDGGCCGWWLGDLAVREGRQRGEGVPVIVIAQAELPIVIPPAGKHRSPVAVHRERGQGAGVGD